MELAIRSGGHSFAGHSSSEGGLVLDLKDMRALELDPARHQAWAEAGLTAGEYTIAAGTDDLATGFGDTATVGIGGLTLGGGVGYLSRQTWPDDRQLVGGRSRDRRWLGRSHRREERIPTSSGPSAGAVVNFGSRRSAWSGSTPYRRSSAGSSILPATPEILAAFVAEAEAAPDELSTIANVMPAPPMPMIPEEARRAAGRLRHHGLRR